MMNVAYYDNFDTRIAPYTYSDLHIRHSDVLGVSLRIFHSFHSLAEQLRGFSFGFWLSRLPYELGTFLGFLIYKFCDYGLQQLFLCRFGNTSFWHLQTSQDFSFSTFGYRQLYKEYRSLYPLSIQKAVFQLYRYYISSYRDIVMADKKLVKGNM